MFFSWTPLFVTVLLISPTSASKEIYKISGNSIPWNKANDSCTSLGFSLMEWRNTSDQSAALQSILAPQETYWTSRYYTKTDFYWKLGCYDVGGKQLSNTTDFGAENSLYRCSTHCRNPEYIGLERSECHCFTSQPTLGKESAGICSAKCPGNPDDTCGGIDKMSLYRMLNSEKEGFDGKDQTDDCYSINKESQEDGYDYDYYSDFETFAAKPCTEQKSFICESSDPDKITGDVYHANFTSVTWFEADQSCLEQGWRLAYFNNVNAPGLLSKQSIPDGAMFWIGLYRQMYSGSINNEDNIEETPYRCEGIKLSDEGLNIVQDFCNETRPAVCAQSTMELEISIAPATTESGIVYTSPVLTTEDATSPTETFLSTTESPAPTTDGSLLATTEESQMSTVGVSLVTTTKLETTETYLTTAGNIETTKTVASIEASTMAPLTTEKTTQSLLTTNEDSNAEGIFDKNIGARTNPDNSSSDESPSSLIILLITLAVILFIVLVLLGFAYRRYRRNKRYQRVRIYGGYQDNVISEEPENVAFLGSERKSSPKKPVRQNSTKLNDHINNNSSNLLPVQPTAGLSPPEARDDISWNLPFIDASRATLDNIDESKPVMVRKSVLLSNSESIVGKEVDAGKEGEEDEDDNDDVFGDKLKDLSVKGQKRSSYSDEEPDETEHLNKKDKDVDTSSSDSSEV